MSRTIRWRRLAAVTAAVVAAGGLGSAGTPAGAAGMAGAPGQGGAEGGAGARRDVRLTRFLGEQRIAHKARFAGTTVGGLSGIDRDPRTGTWYFISDDRWRYNPARFYTGRLDIDHRTGAFTGVRVTGVTTLRGRDGQPYPAYGRPEAADPESIRFDRRTGRILWSSEGDRPEAHNPDIPLSALALRWSGRDGGHLGALTMPRNLRMTGTDSGPRRNAGIEGLTVTPKGIAGALEGPRYEDGSPPTARHGAPARVTLWSRDGRPRAQYVYPLDRLPAPPVPPGGQTDSGISEILSAGGDRFLALERSWIEGVGYKVRLYEFDLRGATNVLPRWRLAGGRYRPVTKRLVADLGAYRRPVQNLESLAWGPRLATGECTLVIGSDDNFSAEEVTQFLAFAVRGC